MQLQLRCVSFFCGASIRDLLYELLDKAKRDLAHLIRRQVADRMRQLDERMAIHAFCAERMQRRVLERRGQKHRRGDAAFFELHCVVHTAQRARPSSADRGGGNLHPFRHRIELPRSEVRAR